jgi:hypothetical protein
LEPSSWHQFAVAWHAVLYSPMLDAIFPVVVKNTTHD